MKTQISNLLVKASERMPEKPGIYFIKVHGENSLAQAIEDRNGKMYFSSPGSNRAVWKGWKDFYWLDEYTQPLPPSVKEAAEAWTEKNGVFAPCQNAFEAGAQWMQNQSGKTAFIEKVTAYSGSREIKKEIIRDGETFHGGGIVTTFRISSGQHIAGDKSRPSDAPTKESETIKSATKNGKN